MFPFDAISYVLLAVVTLSLTLYFSLLMKLKPSVETKLSTYLEDFAGARNKKAAKDNRKTKRPAKVETPEQPSIQDAPEEKECPHYVGYLTTLPKGNPFPDECFGCRKVIQCLRIEPAGVIESFYMAEAEAK